MKTSKQLRCFRRLNNAIALLSVISILTFANFGAYWIGGTVLSVLLGLFSLLVLINFPWYKFK